jgi:putative peptidoglycan lipid II flippase
MSMLRSFATVGGFTLGSRVLGFVRDILIANILGTGAVADAFFVAFRFPNLFRRLFAEGAFNAAFVPLFAKQLEGEGESAARKFASESLNILLAALLVTTALAEIFMPWLMYVIAPGFAGDPDKLDLAILMTRITFPYLFAISLVALLSGVLNSLGKFAVAAGAPLLLNIVFILVLGILAWMSAHETAFAGKALSWGVCAAGILQLIMLWGAARKAGMALTIARPRLTPAVRDLIRLGIPGMIAGGITQINLLVGTMIATLQAGAVSYLYYADRIYQLPLGVVGVAIGIVLLPDLSRRLRAGKDQEASQIQNRALELSMLLTVPAAVALIVIPAPIVSVLFEHGAFQVEDTAPTVWPLMAFAVGLPAFVLIKVFSPGFFAREDTRTPMIFAGMSVAINISGSLALYFLMGHTGIAIATSFAGWINAGLLGLVLYRRGQFRVDYGLQSRLPRIILSSVIMGVALFIVMQLIGPWLAADQLLVVRIAALAALIGSGVAVLAVSLLVTGGVDPVVINRQLFRR